MREISLYQRQLEKIRKRQKVKKLGIKLLLYAALGLAGVMIGLSIWSLSLARSNQRLADEVEATKTALEGLRPVETKQVYLTSKLGSFGKLLKTQEAHQAVAETVFAILPDGTNLKGFEVSDEGWISLSGSVGGYAALMELIRNVVDTGDRLRLPILEAKMKQVSVSKDLNVNFSLDILIGV